MRSFALFVCTLIDVHKQSAMLCENGLKVTLEAQLGLIGGTMGLLTGFSILSGVEIIYFIFRFTFTVYF